VVPISGAPIRDGAVAARAGEVVAVGPAADVAAAHPDLAERDLGGAILLPGLVDAHCHLEWSITAAVLPPGRFATWLGGFLPLRARMGPEDHRAAALLGALRALEAGTTTLADSGPAGTGAAALSRAGLRGLVHLEVFGRQEGREAAEAARAHAERVAALDDDAGPLVRVGVSPHAPYTVSPGLWRALAEHPDLGGRPFATHLAESPEESRVLEHGDGPLAELFRAAGMTPARWPGDGPSVVGRLAAAGALRPGLVAAHCVQVGPADAEALAGSSVGVAHCPQSNARLRCGRAPLGALRAAGVRLGLGTDSPASAGPYDLRGEARGCALVHAAAGAPTPDPAELLALATLGGASALGLDALVGSLERGKRCDLVAVDPPAGAEPGDPCAAALEPGARVRLVVVDGRVVLDEGGPVDLDRAVVTTAASEARARLC
jgi:cytosine/adenosine deaminase-related metal-dependent hydrolase